MGDSKNDGDKRGVDVAYIAFAPGESERLGRIPCLAPQLEETLQLIKPDVSSNEKIALHIIMVGSLNYLNLARIIKVCMTEEQFEQLYGEHKGKSFYEKLKEFSVFSAEKDNYFLALRWQGNGCVETIRKLNGKTKPAEADENSFRSKYGNHDPLYAERNAVHGSATIADGKREIAIFFQD